MSNSSNNQLPTAIRGGTGAIPTPANSCTNPDSKFASNGLSGMFESKSEVRFIFLGESGGGLIFD
jgi:hypothetical protein